MDHGESICTVEIRKQYAPEPFFFSPARWLLDIHQQITISISEIGREGQGIVESESQKKKKKIREKTRKMVKIVRICAGVIGFDN